jgi:hypothetical protein
MVGTIFGRCFDQNVEFKKSGGKLRIYRCPCGVAQCNFLVHDEVKKLLRMALAGVEEADRTGGTVSAVLLQRTP